MRVSVIGESELRQLVPLDREGLENIAVGFRRLSAGEAVQPPIMRIDIPEHHGEVDIKSAYLRGLDSFAVKLSSGFVRNRLRGLPSASGLMVLVSAETGVPLALLLDNGYLTDLRTALAGAVAAELLAPEGRLSVGVVGAGAQARWQLRALTLVREVARVGVVSREEASARRYAEEMSEELGIEVTVRSSVRELVAQSDLLVTTTPSREPLVRAEWLHPGLHITAMGSDAEHKQELEPEVLERADIVACDKREQAYRLGELRAAADRIPAAKVVELGELLLEGRRGRSDADSVTVCDLTGTGVQDTIIARLAFERARRAGAGTAL